MKLYICSGKRSGKDYAAEYLAKKIGLKYEASSMCCARIFIFDTLKDKYNYTTIQECFNDRHNHRAEWFDLIGKFNEDDPTRLSDAIFQNNQCYVGIRSATELIASKERWPKAIVIWIDAEGRVEPESKDSCTVTKDLADFIIENKGSLDEYETKLDKLAYLLASRISMVRI